MEISKDSFLYWIEGSEIRWDYIDPIGCDPARERRQRTEGTREKGNTMRVLGPYLIK